MAKKKATKKAAKKVTKAAKKAAPKKAAKKAAPKKAAKKPAKAKKAGGGRRGGGAAFMKPMTPDDALGAVVGGEAKPRTEIISKLWQYIHNKGLQDKTNKRMINADDSLSKVFGGKRQVSMFEMTKLVNQHLK